MENYFEEKIKGLDEYRWITVEDCSEKLGISTRTVFQYLKDGKIKGVKWKKRRLIDTISIMGFLIREGVMDKP